MNPSTVRIIHILLVVILVFITRLGFAMPDDREKIAELSADSADLNQQTHHGEYIGNVEFDQGTSHLRAARAITEGNQQNKLILAIAFGDGKEQAHFWTQTALDKPPLHAYADTIRYYPERHLVELIGNARVTQGDNSFTGPKISYDTEKQHVISKGNPKNRTTIVIHPEKKA
nr:lipopolysaccharide transport periplasmic protein LptA [Legionella jamestowniensis]